MSNQVPKPVHINKITIKLGDEGFIVANEPYTEEQPSTETFLPFSDYIGKDYKYRCEVADDLLAAAGLAKCPTVFYEQSALEKIDEICRAGRLLY